MVPGPAPARLLPPERPQGGRPGVAMTRQWRHCEERSDEAISMQWGLGEQGPNIEAAERRRSMGSFADRHGKHKPDPNASGITRREALVLAALGLAAPGAAFAAGPDGQLTWGIHVSLAPTWFDPAETPGIITPFMV